MDLVQQYWIFGVGFAGQSLFGVRMIVQWFRSEQEGKVVSPVVYWKISLIASSIILIYGVLRFDAIIIAGQFVSFYIYIRNLQLKNSWKKISPFFRIILLVLPILIVTISVAVDSQRAETIIALMDFSKPLIVLGMIGQIMLNFRFIYQWYYSERKKISTFPLAFWLISLVSSVFILAYGVYKKDPVLLASQGLGVIAYVRNILLYSRRPIKSITPGV